MLPFSLLLAVLLAGLSELVPLAHVASAKRLGGMGFHFLVLQRNGQVFGVGYNFNGQLGLNTTTAQVTLSLPMLFVTNSTDICAGSTHSCVLDEGGQVKCAGANSAYQLGDGTNVDKRVLVPTVGLDSGIAEVQCSNLGSCAKTTSGEVQCWGYIANLQRDFPSSITVSGGVQSLSLGNAHACFVSAAGGKLFCLGRNSFGQLGTGNYGPQTTPTPVVGLVAETIVSVACGHEHTCAVNAGGAMFCWGQYTFGRLGNSSITSSSPNPVQVVGITSGAASAWTGVYHSFALMQNDTVLAFGRDAYGAFGTGSTGQKDAPIVFGQGVSGVVEVRGGFLATCVLLLNDQVKCTGYNGDGQLGVGNRVNSLTLVEMVGIPATQSPSGQPTQSPSRQPTLSPTQQPTLVPTTLVPTGQPTLSPTEQPTLSPTKQPTLTPTAQPTLTPTAQPTSPTTASPTKRPTTATPTKRPTKAPTAVPTKEPSAAPTKRPTKAPTNAPTKRPTTAAPTKKATLAPTKRPSKTPTDKPTKRPTKAPTKRPTTTAPTKRPTTAKPAIS